MFSASFRVWVVVYSLALALLGILSLVSLAYDIPIGAFTRDAAASRNFPPYIGFISNLGILLWGAAAAICLFTSLIIFPTRHRETAWFLLASGLLTLALLLDDLFLFHELLAQQFFSWSEKIIYLLYGLITLIYLWLFRRFIWHTNLTPLTLAFFFFAASIGIDEIPHRWVEQIGVWIYLFEDGAKFLGLINWCGYFIQLSYSSLTIFPHPQAVKTKQTTLNALNHSLERSPHSPER